MGLVAIWGVEGGLAGKVVRECFKKRQENQTQPPNSHKVSAKVPHARQILEIILATPLL